MTELFDAFDDENQDDISFNNLEMFNDAVIWSTDWTAETIVNQLRKGNIDVNPRFQRRDAWSKSAKSKFIESLILGIPIPPIILAESKTKKNSYIVIDGKQRLLTLRQFYSNNDDNFESLKLSHLDYLSNQIKGFNYCDLENNGLNQIIRQIDNQVIRTVVIKNWPVEEFLYTVFLRLNTGSAKLSPQELRQALNPGDFLDYIDDATSVSRQLMKVLNNTKPDTRMRDVELAIRFFAYKKFSKSYKGNLKEFLDYTCINLNKDWNELEAIIKNDFSEFENAIDFAYKVYGYETFTRFNGRFNRAIFEIVVHYFSIQNIRTQIETKYNNNFEKLIQDFRNINENDTEFINSVSSTTKDINKVNYRFRKFADYLRQLLDIDIEYLDLDI